MFERCWPRLRARIHIMLGDDARPGAESGDLLGGLSVRILEKLDSLEVNSETQLLRLGTLIARHLIIDEVRRPRLRHLESVSGQLLRGGGPDEQMPTPSHDAARSEQIERMLAALEQLPPDYREVVAWRSFDALPFAEIGRRLGKSENAVQLLHARALLRLGAAMRERAPG